MPNWVANKLVITGEDRYLSTLREQMAMPYELHHFESFTTTIGHQEVEGLFLLWNIVRPTNLEAYYDYDRLIEEAERRKNAPPAEPTTQTDVIDKLREAMEKTTSLDIQEFAVKFHQDLAVKQDWYNWNIREWGTKWDISDAQLSQKPGELRYEFATAWSPPQPAIDKLAAQYPKLIFTLRCLDENDCFASEMHWRNGFMEFETELEINHGLYEEMNGECNVCSWGDPNDPQYVADNPNYLEWRKEAKCDEFEEAKKLVEEL